MKKVVTRCLMTPALALGLAAHLTAQYPPDAELRVSASMDIYRAGGYDDGSDGIAPVPYTFRAAPWQLLTFPSIGGAWTCNSSVAKYGADGTSNGCPPNSLHVHDPGGPFSAFDLTDFWGSMTGVFLSSTLPSQAPPALRFYVNDSAQGGIQTNFKTLSPAIGQIFFIGDGLTGTGIGDLQRFQVPPTATHLYLGYADSCNGGPVPGCYSDNVGSLSAVVRIEAQELSWLDPRLSVSPPGRFCAGMAYYPATNSLVMFGGDGNSIIYGDTWTWRSGWSHHFPAASPTARWAPGMVYDEAAGNIVLFGGQNSSGAVSNDTWTWDGTTWTQQFPPVSPKARRFDQPGSRFRYGPSRNFRHHHRRCN